MNFEIELQQVGVRSHKMQSVRLLLCFFFFFAVYVFLNGYFFFVSHGPLSIPDSPVMFLVPVWYFYLDILQELD